MELSVNEKSPVWATKYVPSTVDEIILPDNIKNTIKTQIDKGEVQPLLLYGSAGRGKTTLAKAIANDMDASTLFINSSLDTSINIIRNKVINFISTKAVFNTSGRKVVIMDECEQSSPETLNSLKGIIEEYAEHALFIFTTNYINKMPDPLKSRCNMINFDVRPEDKAELFKQVFERSKLILDNEGVEYDPKTLALAVKASFPDFRKLLVNLQKASVTGELDSSAVISQGNYDELIEHIKSGSWKDMREWVANNYQYFDFGMFYNELSNNIPDGPAKAQIVITTSKYDYQSSFVSDKMLNITAYLTEVMTSL